MGENRDNKIIKKTAKIVLYTLAILLILFGTCYSILVTPYFQTRITTIVANYLSGKLHAKVEVRGVDIEFFKKIVLEGFYVEDQHHDTLIYADKLKADIGQLDTKKGIIGLNEVVLDHGKFYLRYYKGENDINLQFILDALSSSDTAAGKPLALSCKNLELKDVSFSYQDINKTAKERGIDFTNLQIHSINGKFSAMQIRGDTILGNIERLSCIDKSGFELKQFTCSASVCPRSVFCEKLRIETNRSHIEGFYSMNYNHYPDFKEYISNVLMHTDLRKSRISMADVAYFADDLWGMDQIVFLNGVIYGTVDHLKAKNTTIETGSRTKITGDFCIKGLPDIQNTLFELKIASLQTDKKSIEEIPLPPFTQKNHIVIPGNISELGLIRFKGEFTGFINNFVTYGKFSTALGNIDSDLNFKFSGDEKTTEYSGKLVADNFQLGKFVSAEPTLGAITAKTELKGTGLSLEHLLAEVDGHIDTVSVNGYRYHDINVSGSVSKKLFSGSMTVADRNLAMKFDGTVDYTRELPVFDFTSTITKANLKRLNLIDRDTSACLATNVYIHLTGDNLDNIIGMVTASNTHFSESGKEYIVDTVAVSSSIIEQQRSIVLRSDVASAEMSGEFQIAKIPQSVNEIVSKIIPSFRVRDVNRSEANSSVQKFIFNFDLKNTAPVTRLFLPEVFIARGTHVSGSFNSLKSEVSLAVNADSLSTYGISFTDLNLKGETRSGVFLFETQSRWFGITDGLQFGFLDVNAQVENDSMQYRIQLSNTDSSLNKADLKGTVSFYEDHVALSFNRSRLVVNNQNWDIPVNSRMYLNANTLSAENFILANGIQQVTINGSVYTKQSDENTKKEMNAEFSNFDIGSIEWYLEEQGVNLGGIISGRVNLSGLISRPELNTNLVVRDFSFNDDTLGTATVLASYETGDNFLTLNGAIAKDFVKTIEINGRYLLNKPSDCLDLDATFQKTYLKKFARYFAFAKDLKGIASGSLHLSGNFSEPVVTGYVMLQKTSFGVEYLNTFYSFTDQLIFTPNAIEFNNIKVFDRFGNSAIANGKIKHEHFKNFVFDVTVSPKNFECLNTNSNLNSMYFGNAIASGNISITGPLEAIVMNIGLKSEKGTKINIPLSNPEEVSQHSFITFVSHDTAKVAKTVYVSDLNGLRLNMDLEITPDADVQIIFDSKIGDVIKGTGSGNLKLEITTLGDFNMFGEYTIENGEYLFTLKNVINKKFIIQKGGTITWNGNALDAEINLNAVYSLRTSLTSLLPDEAVSQEPAIKEAVLKRRQVECWMHMTNKLLNPSIAFDIVIPTLELDNALVSDIVKYNVATEEQKTQQVMSLLVVKQFVAVEQASADTKLDPSKSGTNSAIGSNSTELLSNQLNNWVSQVSNKMDVGVKVSEDELGASLGKHLFNDRLVVDGSVRYSSTLAGLQSNSGIVGDASVEYKISKDGKLRARSFYKSNSEIIATEVVPRQGVGLLYQTEFDNLKELRIRNRLTKLRKKLERNKPEVKEEKEPAEESK